jgi:putative addiction module component (TIGR02574 family)
VTSAAKRILDEALALPDDERAELIEALSDSLHPAPVELTPEQNAELEGRIAELERGDVEAVPWEEVEARVRRSLGPR